jgi:hypothetical protein
MINARESIYREAQSALGFLFSIFLIAVICLVLSACVVRPSPPEVPIIIAQQTVKELQDYAVNLQHRRQERMTEVWNRLTHSNASFCGSSVKGSLGIGLGYRELYDEALRESYQRLYGIGSKPQIIYANPDGAAVKAGLKEGDRIISVNGQKLRNGSGESTDSWVNEDLLPTLEKNGRVKLTIEGENQEQSLVTLHPEPVCRYPVKLLAVQTISASEVDNLRVYITSGLLRFLKNDDQLAWVLGHELAHIVLGTTGSNERNEHMADYVGSYLTARAGYDPEEVVDFFKRWSAENPSTIALEGYKTHPSIANRIQKILATKREIQNKIKRNEPLIPNI